MQQPSFRLKTVFWALTVVFIALICLIVVTPLNSAIEENIRYLFPYLFFILSGLFIVLGALLLVITLKEKTEGRLKKFLLLTGASSIGFVAGTALHNLFYAGMIVFKDIAVLPYLMEGLHVIFFMIAIFVCPIGFLAGCIATGILLLKNKQA